MAGDQRAAARRAFIREHHPDRGGDPQMFITGLQQLTPAVPAESAAPVVVYRTTRFNPARWLRRRRHTRRNLR
jgi:hypothetical protein